MLKPGSVMNSAGQAAGAELAPKAQVQLLQAAQAILGGELAEAFCVLQDIKDAPKHPAVLFNLALCHLAAADYTAAEQVLQSAQGALATPATVNITQSSSYTALLNLDKQSAAYKSPMSAASVNYPAQCKIRILRLLVDIYAAGGQWQKVIDTAAALPQGFANVEKALEQAKTVFGA